jgi:methylthioribose-1-phosphate isomerase
MQTENHDSIKAVQWVDGQVRLLDQRRLPQQLRYVDCDSCETVAKAISDMVIRGAPAIGIAAAYGVALAARQRYRESPQQWWSAFNRDLLKLADARPTAVNLRWAIERMERLAATVELDASDALIEEALRIHREDIVANRRMGSLGASLLNGDSVLTHCNAGSLATGGYGTALGVIRSGYGSGRIGQVYADETRPWLQGSRLTAWELLQDGIPVTLICDGAAATLMRNKAVAWVIVGADRVAANGDVANKIGTYSLAVNARHHGIRFMVVAPTSTIDMNTLRGDDIEIEKRDSHEVLELQGREIGAAGAAAWNPVFDITPAALVDALVTEKGVIHQPNAAKLLELMNRVEPSG